MCCPTAPSYRHPVAIEVVVVVVVVVIVLATDSGKRWRQQ
jgi:hypothetical protein